MAEDSLVIERGREKLRSFTSTADSGNSVTRQFCSECGTPIFEHLQMAPAVKLVKVGTIDDASHLKVDVTAWTASAQPWALIDPATELCTHNPTPRAQP
uniref:GFA family protein n=1 Tax=Tardiphaga alba TaxID=340268 RepID=UPI002013268C|nr:GFA family protein [Tardiphaga alba]